MIELTLMTLLNTVGDNFCRYRSEGNDTYKSLLLSYSDASEKFGTPEVKEVIEKSSNLTIAAVAVAVTKCPQHL
tara:strand:- start:1327 stop:1548 length:222 start_codon:yes stop_codon:yes gene_type:complete